jgi:hypothetical protein
MLLLLFLLLFLPLLLLILLSDAPVAERRAESGAVCAEAIG